MMYSYISTGDRESALVLVRVHGFSLPVQIDAAGIVVPGFGEFDKFRHFWDATLVQKGRTVFTFLTWASLY